jgi:hypothetical protein
MRQISKNDIARAALQRYLRRARFRALRSKLIPLAEKQGIHTDEDVFRRIADPASEQSTLENAVF